MLTRILFAVGLVASLTLSVRASASAAPGTEPRPATVAELTLMMDALTKTASELPRWAYTETRIIRDEKGREKTNTVVRFDPSKPYAEQWTPLSINGKPPSARELQRYRRQGERAEQADDKAERQPLPEGEVAVDRGRGRRVTLGEVLQTHAAKVVSANSTHIVYEIPLRKDRNERFPPEKFEVLARVVRETRTLENVAVRLRESFRTNLVVKVKAGAGSLDFTTVDPARAPTLTQIRGDASASVFFVSVGGDLELTRTDFKAVKPYRERFEVQIGDIKALDF